MIPNFDIPRLHRLSLGEQFSLPLQKWRIEREGLTDVSSTYYRKIVPGRQKLITHHPNIGAFFLQLGDNDIWCIDINEENNFLIDAVCEEIHTDFDSIQLTFRLLRECARDRFEIENLFKPVEIDWRPKEMIPEDYYAF